MGPTKSNNWSDKQRKFQEWLAFIREPDSADTQVDFAKIIGVNKTTLPKWKRLTLVDEDGNVIETWQQAVNRIALAQLGDDVPEVLRAVVEKAKEGSIRHGELVLELAGLWQRRQQHEVTGKDGGPIVSYVTSDVEAAAKAVRAYEEENFGSGSDADETNNES